MLQKVLPVLVDTDIIEILVIEGNNMKAKAVIAAHLQKGQRVYIDSRFYLIDKATRNGHYIDLEVQGAFYPVCLPINQTVKVKL